MKAKHTFSAVILLLSLFVTLASCGKVPSDEGGIDPRASRLDDIAMTTTEPYSFYAGDALTNQRNLVRAVFSYEEAELAYRRMSENCNMNIPFVAFDYEDDEVFPIFWFFGTYKEGTTEEDIKSKPFYELEYSYWHIMTGLYYKDVYTQKEDVWAVIDGDLKGNDKHFVAKVEFCDMLPDTNKVKTPMLTADDIFLQYPDGGEIGPPANGYYNSIGYNSYDHDLKEYYDTIPRAVLDVVSYEPFTEDDFNKIKNTFKIIVLPYET